MNFGGFAVKVRWVRPQNVSTSGAGEKRRRADLSGENKWRRNFFRLRDCGNFKLVPLHCNTSGRRSRAVAESSNHHVNEPARARFWFWWDGVDRLRGRARTRLVPA